MQAQVVAEIKQRPVTPIGSRALTPVRKDQPLTVSVEVGSSIDQRVVADRRRFGRLLEADDRFTVGNTNRMFAT